MVELATADLHIRETEGSNRGPGIEKYWSATSYPGGYEARQPYCAAAVCWWVEQAAKDVGYTALPLLRSARAFDFHQWGKTNDSAGRKVSVIAKSDEILPGDIIVFSFSHVGIAEARSPKGRDVQTIEANTSPSSTNNEGGGVYRRTRSRNLIRAIVRITA
ncbi:hypothetical protein OKA04_12430 [Luteolibacter flavescens]|uniref:CHAP domain-containing protein n=1 Tax=Luteolibacter flavescens TaxID=1859460 RepID=A0ABT3FPN3_9BACT|nr:CHAP domain-containing protein [Luteolibacter flavescens]MCW1885538.1 hypothetical protein [Luteolibacter flavescens]